MNHGRVTCGGFFDESHGAARGLRRLSTAKWRRLPPPRRAIRRHKRKGKVKKGPCPPPGHHENAAAHTETRLGAVARSSGLVCIVPGKVRAGVFCRVFVSSIVIFIVYQTLELH